MAKPPPGDFQLTRKDIDLTERGKIVKPIRPDDTKFRIDAGFAFVHSTSINTIDALRELDSFKDIPIETLRRWAKKDQWVERKREFIAELSRKYREKTSSTIVNDYDKEIKRLNKLKKKADELLFDDMTRPKSWEGVANMSLKLGERILELRGGLREEFDPEHVEQNTSILASAEERQAIINAVLEQRLYKETQASDGNPNLTRQPPEQPKFLQAQNPAQTSTAPSIELGFTSKRAEEEAEEELEQLGDELEDVEEDEDVEENEDEEDEDVEEEFDEDDADEAEETGVDDEENDEGENDDEDELTEVENEDLEGHVVIDVTPTKEGKT